LIYTVAGYHRKQAVAVVACFPAEATKAGQKKRLPLPTECTSREGKERSIKAQVM
jgi:hypothetical protein